MVRITERKMPHGILLAAMDNAGLVLRARYCPTTGVTIFRDYLEVPEEMPEIAAEILHRRRGVLVGVIRRHLGTSSRGLLETGEVEMMEGLTALY